jgi:hypothetical protein
MDNEIETVRIINWKRHNARKDVDKPSWFRMENTIMFDRKLFRLNSEEKWVWVCLLAFASQANSDTFPVDLEYFACHSGVAKHKFMAALEKLESNQCVQLSTRRRNADVTPTCLQTDRQTDRQNGEHVAVLCVSELKPEGIQEIWNENSSRTQTKCHKLTDDRNKEIRTRLKDYPDKSYWESVAKTIARTEWCNGGKDGKGWVADFDYFISKRCHRKFFDIVQQKVPLEAKPTEDPFELERQKQSRIAEREKLANANR